MSRSLHLFEWDESRGVSGTDTGATVTNGLVSHGELANVVVDHLGLDLDLVEDLAVVNANDGADHLGDDDDVAQVSLDASGLLTDLAGQGFLGLAETLEEVLLSALDAAVEMATLTATEQLDQVLGFHVQELVEVDTAEGVLLEGALLLDLDFRHGEGFVSVFC